MLRAICRLRPRIFLQPGIMADCTCGNPPVAADPCSKPKPPENACGMASSCKKEDPCGGGKQVAVVLSGCGVNDGSEIHEAVSVLSHFSRNGIKTKCFAPDINQMHVINHLLGNEECGVVRNVLVESARISRGDIVPLDELRCTHRDYDAIVFPGGFGVAKNLSDFATKGADMTVSKDVQDALKAFHQSKKPIGLCCISPILAAAVIPGVTITLGKSCGDEWPFKDAIEAAKKLGANHVEKEVYEVAVDCENKVFSTPAYMYGPGKYHEIDDGIGNMITQVVKSIK